MSKKNTTIIVDEDTQRKFKAYCVKNKTTMSNEINIFMECYNNANKIIDDMNERGNSKTNAINQWRDE